MKVVELRPDRTEALSVLDDMRAKVESGEIVAFIAGGITKDDGTVMWVGSSERKSNLQMLGAVENLKLHFWNGDIK